MKKIQPLNIWSNGQTKSATQMSLSGNDNLSNSATFYYCLFAEQGEKVADGNLTMTGKDYEDWKTNQYAWDWAAKELGLTLISDEKQPIIELGKN